MNNILSNWAVTGASGNVGKRMVERGCTALYSDVCDAVALDIEISRHKPSIIFHLASKSDVNWCEHNAIEAGAVNSHGSQNVYEIAEKYGTRVVLISSDHVFSGDWWGSYQENSTDMKPVNVYGMTKLIAEAATLPFDNVSVVRTSTLFWGERYMYSKYMDLLKNDEAVYPPFMIWRSFMHIEHFVDQLISYGHIALERDVPKIMHLSGSKNVSWYRLIHTLASTINKEHLVRPRYANITLPGEAPRPLRAGLDTQVSEKFGIPQYDYKDAINYDLGSNTIV